MTKHKIQHKMGSTLSSDEIEFSLAVEEKDFQEHMWRKFGEYNDYDVILQIVKHVLRDPEYRADDFLKILNFAQENVVTGDDDRRLCRWKEYHRCMDKVYTFCKKNNQERYIPFILSSEKIARTFLVRALESGGAFGRSFYEFSNLRHLNPEVLCDIMLGASGKRTMCTPENESMIAKIVPVFRDNFNVDVAKLIIDTGKWGLSQRLDVLNVLFTDLNVICELDAVYFFKFAEVVPYERIVELQLNDLRFRDRPMPFGKVDREGYDLANAFLRLHEKNSFEKITHGFSSDFKALGKKGQTELLRKLVWGPVSVKKGMFDMLFRNGIFVPIVIHELVKTRRFDVIELYLKYGGDITGVDFFGKYAWEYADRAFEEKLYRRLVPVEKKSVLFIDETSSYSSAD